MSALQKGTAHGAIGVWIWTCPTPLTDDQRGRLLPNLASGASIATTAFTEESARYTADGIQLEATPTADGYLLNGTKLFVDYAHVAEHLLVPARTDSSGTAEEGITVLIVPAA